MNFPALKTVANPLGMRILIDGEKFILNEGDIVIYVKFLGGIRSDEWVVMTRFGLASIFHQPSSFFLRDI